MHDLATLAESERHALYGRALAEYDGRPKMPLTRRPGDPDDNVITNYPSLIVDKGVAFLFGNDQKIGVKPKGATTDNDKKAEELLEEIWPEDERAEDLIDLATNGAIFGDVWAKIVLTDGEPRVCVLDPMNMTAFWSADDYRDVWRYRSEYNTFNEAGDAVVRRQDIEREGAGQSAFWWIRDFESKADQKAWVELHDPIKWKWAKAPVYHVKNLPKANEFYGKPDLTKYTLALAHYLNRADSLINRILRLYAHPKPIAKNLRSQDLNLGSTDILFLPQADQELSLLEMKSDLQGALAFRKQLREALAEVSHVPEIATSKSENIGQLSGRALQILYAPLIDRTKVKRRLYGRFLKALVAGLLEVKGITDQEVSINWAEMLPTDEKESAETALNLMQIGVSKETLQERMGFNPVKEKQRTEAEGGDMASIMLRAFDGGKLDTGATAAGPGKGDKASVDGDRAPQSFTPGAGTLDG